MGAGRAFGQFPLVAEQHVEIAVVPLSGIRFPCTFDAAGGGINALAGAKTVLPAQSLLFDGRALGFGTHQPGVACAVGLAESMSAGNQRHGLFVVHGHSREGFAHIAARAQRIGIAIRAFRIHIDQAHLHCGEGILKVAVAGVALVTQPGVLRTPVNVFFRFPDVLAAAGESECLETHRFQCNVAREDHQVSPGNFAAILLLDRPQQTPRLVQVPVVGPTVQRRESLVTSACATPAVVNAIGAGAVPGHANHQPAIMAPVSGPPVLRIGHQRFEILDYGLQVQRPELPGVVKRLSQRIA